MNDWMDDFISQILTDIPRGRYRARTEKELRDHMEALRHDLTEAEVLRAMGEPEKLQKEYRAAWRRSLPGRLAEPCRRLKAWAVGWAVMFGVHLLISTVIGHIWSIAIALPADSSDPQIKLIRGTLGNLNNSLFWSSLFPLLLALTAGALYLRRKFRTSSHPVWLISAGLCLHWTFITALLTLLRAAFDHHRPFWEAVGNYLGCTAGYHSVTLLLCLLLGYLFGRNTARSRELA